MLFPLFSGPEISLHMFRSMQDRTEYCTTRGKVGVASAGDGAAPLGGGGACSAGTIKRQMMRGTWSWKVEHSMLDLQSGNISGVQLRCSACQNSSACPLSLLVTGALRTFRSMSGGSLSLLAWC